MEAKLAKFCKLWKFRVDQTNLLESYKLIEVKIHQTQETRIIVDKDLKKSIHAQLGLHEKIGKGVSQILDFLIRIRILS